MTLYDVIVIGGGHAGIEAAAAAARMGCSVALVTIQKNKIGHMPCNPSVGGIGKGHIVFEISALGGVMPHLCTQSYLQANMLNMSKGPAVQGLRLQIDKVVYAQKAQEFIANIKNITVIEGMVKNIIIHNNKVQGIRLDDNNIIYGGSVVLTTGTFLNGLLHTGLVNFTAGRENERASTHLTESLKREGIDFGRLKTGTPPRLLKESLNFSVMEEQKSHDLKSLFEYYNHIVHHKHSCYITRTNNDTHTIIKNNAHLSPIYRKDIKGIAPRYCPSIEDKIDRFAEKDSHHIFVEPESLFLNEMYPNGLSTSLPREIQELFIRSIRGFENAIIVRPGYAIEYDFIFPNQLKETLECKKIEGLFSAGQINGTTGYEEAAGQGLIAGINAACLIHNKKPFIMNREESYIGVMINDIVTLGIDEPYRMFTSRAERRLILRQDNVFYRLFERAYEYNLIEENLYNTIKSDYEYVLNIVNSFISNKNIMHDIAEKISFGQDQEVRELIKNNNKNLTDRMIEYIFGELLYYPYYERELKEKKKLIEYRNIIIPDNYSFKNIPGLSIELQQKLEKIRPKTIADAALISGITPAALSLLILLLKKS